MTAGVISSRRCADGPPKGSLCGLGRDFVWRGGNMENIPRRERPKVKAKNRARFRGHVHTGETWHAEGEFAEARNIFATVIDGVRRS